MEFSVKPDFKNFIWVVLALLALAYVWYFAGAYSWVGNASAILFIVVLGAAFVFYVIKRWR